MAPEQIQGKPRPASDQYSLGIVIYEWLSGIRPIRGSFTEIMGQHISAPPAPLREQIPKISPAVEEVVMKALAKDPKERFAKVSDLAKALEQASQSAQPIQSGVVVLSNDRLSPTSNEAVTPPNQTSLPDFSRQVQKSKEEALFDAFQLLEANSHTEALTTLNTVLALDPDLANAHNAKGLSLYHLKKYTEPLTALDHAVALNSNDATARYGRGLVLEKLKRFADALLEYDQIMRFDATYAPAWRQKGHVLSEMKHFEEALSAYEKALQLNQNDADAYIGKGNVLKHLGRLKKTGKKDKGYMNTTTSTTPVIPGFLIIIGIVAIFLFLILFLIYVSVWAQRRHELARFEAEQEDAQRRAEQEVRQMQRSKATAKFQYRVTELPCPNCGTLVQTTQAFCPHCRFLLSASASGLHLHATPPPNVAPQPQANYMQTSGLPAPTISDLPTMEFSPANLPKESEELHLRTAPLLSVTPRPQANHLQPHGEQKAPTINPQPPSNMPCPNCAHTVRASATYCPNCRYQLTAIARGAPPTLNISPAPELLTIDKALAQSTTTSQLQQVPVKETMLDDLAIQETLKRLWDKAGR